MYKILENSQPFLRTTTQSAYKFMIDYFQVDTTLLELHGQLPNTLYPVRFVKT